MEIDLRQHQDGRFFLDVRVGSTQTEIDVTSVLHEIFLGKLRELQGRVRAEEKYRDWVVGKAKTTSSAMTTMYERYKNARDRLYLTNSLVIEVIDAWRTSKSITRPMVSLETLVKQNDHFLTHDITLEEMEKAIRGK